VLTLIGVTAVAQQTQRQYLSGIDKDNTVNWEFFCTSGRNSGKWTTIPVPSNWEFHGFGNFAYGRDDRTKPVESGQYRHTFKVPQDWSNKRIFIVFDGSMTDTTVKINGQPAGEKHQGSFYRFRYDITKLVNFTGENRLEVTVDKLSSDESVNRAERQSDYWLFGGIFRPVWLEAVPNEYIDHVAIDAKADGTIAAHVRLSNVTSADRVVGQVRTLDGAAVGEPVSMQMPENAGPKTVLLRTKAANVKTWTSETPHLYHLEVSLMRGNEVIHRIDQRFGFRTVEIRPQDGIYINGVKVILKGVNRHSFWPDSGRCLSRKISEMDVALMKDMNMNAVRMSHYPPDEHFLDVCDEQGLYVLDELAGWQKAYGTAVGRKLVKEMIERDVNHPSIIIWDNGNEGGWNTELDDDFAKYDPQKRQVIHPWGVMGPTNTKHYPDWNTLTKLLKEDKVFFPTEFLHGLYDGGAGAGLNDYWDAMMKSKTCAGGFIWALVDEGVKRGDLGGKIDVDGNRGPDGIVGPYREKEGSFYTIKQIWSPVVIEKFDAVVWIAVAVLCG
jgi:beta-galactosidase/beta-glucuronidase